MTIRRLTVLASLALAVVTVFLVNAGMRAQQAEPQATTAAARMIDSARSALEAARTMYEVGKVPADEIYQWSRRLMEAEIKADPANRDAVAAHVQRMRDLLVRVKSLFDAGSAGGEQLTLDAVTYYVAEAESL